MNNEVELVRAILGGWANDGWDYWVNKCKDKSRTVIPGYGHVDVVEFGGFDVVDSYGYSGGYYSLVFKVTRDEQVRHFRKHGTVSSYDGDTIWNGKFEEVTPVTKVVTEWKIV